MDNIIEDPIVASIPESPDKPSKFQFYFKKALIIAKWLAIGFFVSTIFTTVLFSFVNPPLSPLMLQRALIKKPDGKRVGIHKDWVPYRKISPHMIQAVIASEDNRFAEHFGIDLQAVQKAVDYNKKHRRKRGASTITQQVAKNVFLWPARTYIRKGFELYFTVMIEAIWSKKRIMVVYLNVMETGNGLYGVEAAAQKYFHKSAAKLTASQAALIAASLPNPRFRNPAKPTDYMIRRQARIMSLMRKIGKQEL